MNRNDLVSIALIKSQYKQFETFSNIPAMPVLRVKILHVKDAGKTTTAVVTPPHPGSSTYSLEIRHGFENVYKGCIRSLLYHEFTHILDYEKYTNGLIGLEKKKYCEFYSEVHASKIQMMVMLGCDNILSQNRVPLDFTFTFSGEEFTLNGFMSMYFSEVNKYIARAITAKTEALISRAIKHVMYYFGFLLSCEQHCTSNIDHHMNIEEFSRLFGSYALDAYALLQKIDAPTTEDIENLQEMRAHMYGFAKYMCKI